MDAMAPVRFSLAMSLRFILSRVRWLYNVVQVYIGSYKAYIGPILGEPFALESKLLHEGFIGDDIGE